MSEYVIGIDPGTSGAVAILKDGAVELIERMPKLGGGRDTGVDAQRLLDLLSPVAFERLDPEIAHIAMRAVIEKPQVMGGGDRKMGVRSAFQYGAACQVPMDVLTFLGIPYQRVAPQTWRKWLPGSPKGRKDVKAAIERYVRERLPNLGKISQDCLDALFLALATPPSAVAAAVPGEDGAEE